jgi:serine/threonine protein kinase
MQPRDVVNGRFEIDRVAGAGGMGTVFLARDRQTGGPVAIKVILGHSRDLVERFVREATVLAELRHPGIVGFVASGATPDGEAYLVMDWLEGESLKDRLARGTLSIAETIQLGLNVAEALSVAHARGVVHRDLKPGNLFLVGGDLRRVTILDFGIARVVEGGPALTRTGATLGSPGYVSPEQARGVRNLDASADVFSLACVLFKCLTGDPPFTGELLQVLMKVVMDPAPLASSRRPDVPPALEDLLQRMLAKPPAARPRDAAAVATELRALATPPSRAERAPVTPFPYAPPASSAPSARFAATFNPRPQAHTPLPGATTPIAAPASMAPAPSSPSSSAPPARRADETGVLSARDFLPASTVAPSSLLIHGAQLQGRASTMSGPPPVASTARASAASSPSTIAEPSHPPPPSSAVPAPAQSAASAPSAAAPSRWRPFQVVLVAGAVLTLLVGAAVLVDFLVPTSISRYLPGGGFIPCGPAAKCVAFNPADPAHVDLMEVLPAATQLAQSIDKGATFCEMSMTGAVEGTLPLGSDIRNPTPSSMGLIRFAGKGTHGVEIAVMPGRLVALDVTCPHPAPVPACTPRAAARAAAASGAPHGGSTVMSYHHDDASGGVLWDYMPVSHPDGLRRLDGRTCAVKYKPR